MLTRSFASRFESGSSIRNAFGSRTIARPIATRWRCPPESAAGRRSSSFSSPSISATSVDPAARLVLRASCAPSGRSRGSRARSCAGRAHRSGRPSRCRASGAAGRSRRGRRSRSTPPVTSSRPAIMRSSVDLPHPEGPTSTRNSPFAISSDTSSTATTPPLNTFRTWSSTIPDTGQHLYRRLGKRSMALTNFEPLGYSRPTA